MPPSQTGCRPAAAAAFSWFYASLLGYDEIEVEVTLGVFILADLLPKKSVHAHRRRGYVLWQRNGHQPSRTNQMMTIGFNFNIYSIHSV